MIITGYYQKLKSIFRRRRKSIIVKGNFNELLSPGLAKAFTKAYDGFCNDCHGTGYYIPHTLNEPWIKNEPCPNGCKVPIK